MLIGEQRILMLKGGERLNIEKNWLGVFLVHYADNHAVLDYSAEGPFLFMQGGGKLCHLQHHFQPIWDGHYLIVQTTDNEVHVGRQHKSRIN